MSPGEAAGESADQRALARSRILFLTSHALETGAVRTPILASWRRSRDMRVAANEVNPILEVNPDLDTFLSRAAAPVLQRPAVGHVRPAGQHRAHRPARPGPHPAHRRHARWSDRLDGVGLAPGFNYAENSVGTNGIGTALEVGAATHVFGHEHYAERLEDLACAGVPIKHPLTGRTVGLVDLTCWRRDAGTLLLALAKTTAQQVQTALLNASSVHERELLDEYLRICRRSSGDRARRERRGRDAQRARPHRAVGGRAGEPADPRHARRSRPDASAPRRSTSPAAARPGCTCTRSASRRVRPGSSCGSSVRRSACPPSARRRTGGPRPLPGLVGTVPVWTARLPARSSSTSSSREWLAVVGEPGVGKLALLQAVQLRRQPVPRDRGAGRRGR